MKIIVLGTRGFPNVQGGIEKHCQDLYPRLAALGCDVTVLARAPYVGPNMYEYKGVNVVPMACPKHKYLEAFLHTFMGVIKARFMNPDIIHIHAIGPSLFVPLARLLGMKVVITHHGPDYERKKWNMFSKTVLRTGELLGVTYAHQVITISKVIAKEIYQEFQRESTVIPNGVNVIKRVNDDDTLKTYGLEKGKYILAVGRFVPEKGFTELVESFEKLTLKESGRLNGWKLVIAGDADHEDEFSRDLKAKSGRVSDVVLTGFQNGKALQELYTHAGHFILPSFHEGLPIVLLEALSYGASCLVSDIPANREVGLEDERYFKPGDVQMMARKISDFMERPATEEQRAGRIQHILDRYNWVQIAHRTFQAYMQVETYGGLSIVQYQTKPMFSFGANTP